MTNKSSSCSSHCRPTLPELKLYQAFIFSIPILFTLVLLLLFYMLYLRRRRTAWITSQARIHYQDRGFISVPSDSERGVKKEFRDTLPIMIFNQSFLEEDTQCAVCLGEYEADDMLKQLPVCGHAFHLECIDHWLQNNITCPLCRTSLPQANKVVPLDSSANVTVPQQTHDFILASALQQVQSIQDVPVQEVLDMQNARREEEIRPINGSLSDETSSTDLDIHRDEIYVAVLQGGHSIANADTAMHIESTGM